MRTRIQKPTVCLLFAGFVCVTQASPSWSPENMPDPDRQPAACGRADVETGRSRVCDPDSVLSMNSRNIVEGIIQDIEAGRDPYATMDCADLKTGYKVAVALVRRMQMAPASDPADVAESFATQLHNQWGVGDAACNNGVLLFLAIEDRQMYISTGKGAMKALPYSRVQQVLAKMRSQLRAGQYDKAVQKATIHIGVSLAGEDIEEANSDGHDWALIVALMVVASLAGYSCYSAVKRNDEYRACKNLLVKLRRDQEKALQSGRYDSSSCPICMEDFKEEVRPLDAAAAAQTDAKARCASGDEVRQHVPGGTDVAPLLPPHGGSSGGADSVTSSGDGGGLRPLMLPCGHRFCDPCITRWLDKSKKLTCPVCRKPIRSDDRSGRSSNPATGNTTSSSSNNNDGNDDSGGAGAPRPPCADTADGSDAYNGFFMPEARFRMSQLHIRYPYFVTSSMVDTWGSEMAHGQIMSTPAQIDAQMASAQQAAHSQSGSVGATTGFGGGSSFGGGGGGSSW